RCSGDQRDRIRSRCAQEVRGSPREAALEPVKEEFCFPTRPGSSRPFLHSIGPGFPPVPDSWRYAAIEIYKIFAGDAFTIDTRPTSPRDGVTFGAPSSIDREACLVVLSGSCTVRLDGRDE